MILCVKPGFNLPSIKERKLGLCQNNDERPHNGIDFNRIHCITYSLSKRTTVTVIGNLAELYIDMVRHIASKWQVTLVT